MSPEIPEISTFFLYWFPGIVLSLLLFVWKAGQHPETRLMHWLDVALAAGLSGTVTARLIHVRFVEWDYFSTYPEDIFQIWYGGLTWHGAVIGGIIGAWIMSRWHRLDTAPVSDGIALALSAGFIFTWFACRAAACGYAEPVDSIATTSGFLTGFLPDSQGDVALRLELQIIGVWVGLLLLLLITWLTLTDRLSGRRLWLLLALMGGAMFLMGFWRGESAQLYGDLRQDQLFDLLLSMTGVLVLLHLQYTASNRTNF